MLLIDDCTVFLDSLHARDSHRVNQSMLVSICIQCLISHLQMCCENCLATWFKTNADSRITEQITKFFNKVSLVCPT